MNVVVIISANAEWRVVKELYPNLEIQISPYGEFADLTLRQLRTRLDLNFSMAAGEKFPRRRPHNM